MAYWLDSAINFKSKNRKAFLIDDDSELANLPTTTSYGLEQTGGQNVINKPVEMGSVAYSIGSQNRFCLNSQDQWIKVKK